MRLKAFIKTTDTQALVEVKDGKVICNTLQLAAKFGKNHFDVLKSLQNIECSQGFRDSNYTVSSYPSLQGKSMPMYEMTRDGFTFLVMGFTGKKAAEWKEKYIMAFNIMEGELKSQIRTTPTTVDLPPPCIFNDYGFADIAKAFDGFMNMAERIGQDRNLSAISANQAVNRISGINVLQLLGKTHLESERQELFFTPTELGTKIGASGQEFNILLRDYGLQEKLDSRWIPTEDGKQYSRIFDVGKRQKHGAAVQQVRWSASVLELFKY